MAASRRLARHFASDLLCQQKPLTRTPQCARTFATGPKASARIPQQVKRPFRPSYQIRHATNATATAPNSKAYLESGVIAGAQNLVDVKKVLVIGSGGLAIGQAGEFDYSGK